MKSIKYLGILISNAALLAFLIYLTADPLERWLGEWSWAQVGFKVLYATVLSAFLILLWVGIRFIFKRNSMPEKSIGIAIALTVLGSSTAYWTTLSTWARRNPLPDRVTLISKLQRTERGIAAANLTLQEYDLLRFHFDWRAIPEKAYHISLQSNGEDQLWLYPAHLRYVVPPKTETFKSGLPWDAPLTLTHDVEDMGDSVVVKVYFLGEE